MNSPNGYPERFCALVDVLGFRQLLKDLAPAKIERLLTRVHHPQIGRAINLCEFRAQSISDAVAMSAVGTSEGLDAMLYALEALTLDLLTEGYFARGALIKGQLHHDGKMLFGPALVEAYRLETEVVSYPRIMVSSDVLRTLKGWKGKDYKPFLRFADDGPCYLHVLRRLEEIRTTENPDAKIVERFTQIQRMVQKRFRQSIDEPRHFRKVQWFARYWNKVVPPGGIHGIFRVKGAGAELEPPEWA